MHLAVHVALSVPMLFISFIIWSCDPALAQSESIISPLNVEAELASDEAAYKERTMSMVESRNRVRMKRFLSVIWIEIFRFVRYEPAKKLNEAVKPFVRTL